MSESGPSASRLQRLASMAGTVGKAAVVPAVQDIVRDQVVDILQEQDPEKLQELIYVEYPLVRRQMPERYVNVLGQVGPQFEDEIRAMVHPSQVLKWLKHPDEWMDVEENPTTAAKIRKCHEVITETEGGEEWLAMQTYHLYQMAGVA